MDTNQGHTYREFLQMVRRIRARLKNTDPSNRFPVEEGWRALKARIGEDASIPGTISAGTNPLAAGEEPAGKRRVIPMPAFRYVAAAAIGFLVAAGGYWWTNRNEQPAVAGARQATAKTMANLPPSQGVTLILADGRRVPVGQKQTLTEKGGVAIHMQNGAVQYTPPADKQQGARKNPPGSTPVLMNTLEVPRGNRTKLTLPDGTLVWINAASRLTYPAEFTGPTRELTLEGEAFFDVSKDPAHPFLVHTRGMAIQVLGTTFDVNSYDPDVKATLESGKVNVLTASVSLTLEPGEQAGLDPNSGKLSREKVNVKSVTAWKNGNIYLDNVSFSQLADILGRMYDYEWEFQDPALKKLHFTIDMPAPSGLQAVLDHIQSTTEDIQFDINGRNVRIHK